MISNLTKLALTMLILFPLHSGLSGQIKNDKQNKQVELNNKFYRIAVEKKNGGLISLFGCTRAIGIRVPNFTGGGSQHIFLLTNQGAG